MALPIRLNGGALLHGQDPLGQCLAGFHTDDMCAEDLLFPVDDDFDHPFGRGLDGGKRIGARECSFRERTA